MWALLRFLALGLLTAAVGEWQFSVFLRGDLRNFLGALVFDAFYLTGVYALTRPLLNTLRQRPSLILAYGGCTGCSGLMVEWFLIGNSPWGNPDASQTGMFAYWACMALVPLVFLLDRGPARTFIGRYALAYTAVVLLGEYWIPSADWRDAFHIYAFILGYSGLMLGIVWYGAFARRRR